ncbi:MAG: MscL family protein [Endomicrobiales bacterium]|jgi:large conductance mechanosensitive channel
MKGFIEFIRTQGVIGLSIGFILGGAIGKLVTALVNDLINPLVGILLGAATGLRGEFIQIGTSKFMWGDFVNSMIDFMIIAGVVYFVVRGLGLDKLDKKQADKPL